MEDLKIIWDGNSAKVGRIAIGSVAWNGTRQKGNPNEYVAYCKLPQIKPNLGEFLTKEDAMKKIETVWSHWIKMLQQEKQIESK